jgi:hypothetical protein
MPAVAPGHWVGSDAIGLKVRSQGSGRWVAGSVMPMSRRVRSGWVAGIGRVAGSGQVWSGKCDRKCSELACNVRSHRAEVGSRSLGNWVGGLLDWADAGSGLGQSCRCRAGSGWVARLSLEIRQNQPAIDGDHQNQPFWVGVELGLKSQGQMSDDVGQVAIALIRSQNSLNQLPIVLSEDSQHPIVE